MPGGLIVFFKSGPLDWRGFISLYLLLAAFTVWVVTLVWALLTRAIRDQEREAAQLAGVSDPSAEAAMIGAGE
jgi:hypothetical protein